MAIEAETITDVRVEELRARVAWLIRLRWLAAAGVAITIWYVPRGLGIRLEEPSLHLVTAALAAYNGVLWSMKRWWSRLLVNPALSWFTNIQISIDLLFLTVLLHFAGGIENPFIYYYVFHIVIASILLSRRATFGQATLAMLLLTEMSVLEAVALIPHYQLGRLDSLPSYRVPLFIFAKLFVVSTTLYFTAFMSTSITKRLRQRENEIMHLSASLRDHAINLEQAYNNLRDLEREKSEYMHRVAHHLRSPLATLERMLAVISEGRTGAITEKSHEMLEQARARIANLLTLGKDLLTLSRAREVSLHLHTTTVDLRSILKEVEEDFREQAAQASVMLQHPNPDLALPINGDPASLTELFENLISNAIKYTPAGGSVEVRAAPKDSGVEITVRDSGIGIPREEMDRIFEDFYRATNVRKQGMEGTGLGLSIVKAVAEAHGGKVSIESEVGSGTMVKVWLPTEASGSKMPWAVTHERPVKDA